MALVDIEVTGNKATTEDCSLFFLMGERKWTYDER